MKIFAHIGMPKTGTSSIQDTFAFLKQSDPLYLVPRPANHGNIAALLFEKVDAQNRRFISYGRKLEAVEKDREKWTQILRQTLSEATASVGLFSAERLSSIDDDAVKRMHEFFTEAGADLRVLGYARPAASYLASAFQQNVKAGENTFNLDRAWPAYADRFEKYDRIIGRDAVILRPFLREEMFGGDVVLDFANIVGAEIDPDQIVRSNDSLSLEAVALLYVQRKFGTGFQRADIFNRFGNRALIECLKNIGTTRFEFSKSLMIETMEQHREDLNWIEKRIGVKMDGISAGDGGIGSEAMLIEAATRAAPLLDQLEPGLYAGDDPEAIAAALDKFIVSQGKMVVSKRGLAASEDAQTAAIVNVLTESLRKYPMFGGPDNAAGPAREKTAQISRQVLRNLDRAGFTLTQRD